MRTHPTSIKREMLWVMMTTSVVGLLLIAASVVVLTVVGIRHAIEKELGAVTQIVADSTAAPLLFSDYEASRKVLRTLRSEEQITHACVFTKDGRVFAQYDREPGRWRCPGATDKGTTYGTRSIGRFEEITLEREKLGYVYLESDLAELHRLERRSITFTLLALLASALVAFILAYILQGRITSPLLRLARTAAEVSSSKNYSLRASVTESQGEIAVLIHNFNQMLCEIETRDTRLKEHESHLEAEVRSRTAELTAALDDVKKTQGALKRSESSLRSFVDHSPFAIFRSDVTGDRLLEVNSSFLKAFGYTDLAEIAQLRLSEDLYFHKEDRDPVIAGLTSQGIVRAVEVDFKRKDGQPLRARMSGTLCADDIGRLSLFEGFIEDITERKSLEEQLRQSQKMEAIGRLAGGIAHDFNNMLTAVIGYSDLLLATAAVTGKQRRQVEQISKAAHRAADLTRQLLAFSRQQVLQPQNVDINKAVEETLSIVSRLIGEHITVEVSPAPGTPAAFVDPSQLVQILMNLCLNARDAMLTGGTIRIGIETVCVDEHVSALHSGLLVGDYVRISISDTGEGMTPEVQAKIFEPFFTTKGLGKGTGLGLATVYGLLKQSEGYISVYSERGLGSCFKVYLPTGKTSPVKSELRPPASTPDQCTILIVDDNDIVLEGLSEYLADKGHKVLRAKSGQDAVALSSAFEDDIDVLVSDVVMPTMSGCELVELIRSQRPSTRALLMSGYAQEALVGRVPRDTRFLQKPFSLSVFERALGESLFPRLSSSDRVSSNP